MRQLFVSIFLVLLTAAGQAAGGYADIEQLLENGKAQQAYELAQSRASKNIGEPDFDYLLGLAALESGQANQAVFALERVLMVQPQNQRARMALARAHLQLKNDATARAEFNMVLQAHPSLQEKQAIEQYLNEIDRRLPKPSKPTQAYLELMAGHDSNVNSATQDNTIFAAPAVALSDASRATGSSFQQFNYGWEGERPWSPSKSLFASVTGSSRSNNTTDIFDMRVTNLKGGASFSAGNNFYRLPLHYQQIDIGDGRFRRLWMFSPQWTHTDSFGQQAALFAQMGIQHYPDQPTHDVRMGLLGVAWLKHLGESAISTGAYYSKETALNSEGKHNARNLFGVRINGLWKVAPQHTAYTNLTLQQDKHEAPHPIYNQVRTDTLATIALGWRWQAGLHWSLGTEASYTRNNSNLNLFQYQRVQYQVSTRYDF